MYKDQHVDCGENIYVNVSNSAGLGISSEVRWEEGTVRCGQQASGNWFVWFLNLLPCELCITRDYDRDENGTESTVSICSSVFVQKLLPSDIPRRAR